ncbi:MAG: hypothetical protein AB1705_14005 [Verrucomicrobiota bacterium]
MVSTRRNGLFTKGIVARGKITFSGQATSDSFDSSDPAYSTNGRYDVAKRKDNGDIASNLTVEKSIDTSGQVKIYGRVSTGPKGTVGLSGQVAFGTKAWIDGGNKGIQPGRSTDDMNVSFADVAPPFNGGAFAPAPGTVNGTNYTYVLDSEKHQLSKLDLSGSQKVIVKGNVTLYVTGDISVSGQAFIYIAPGASLKLYVGGASTSLSGQGVANADGNASNFSYWGLPENKNVTLSGDAAFTGTIYAPNAVLTLSGGGTDIVDFSGAAIVGEAKVSGHYHFHYDENLGRLGSGGFVVTGWNEI